jgi:hypothetical protein
VLKFDDNGVVCERDDEIVVFVRVGDVFDESDCGIVVEFVVVGIIEIGVFIRGGISKISTISEYPLEL